MNIEELDITPYEELPQDVKAIIDSYNESEDNYTELSRMQQELKAIGWFMDYYLNAEITELRPMTEKELKEVE